MATLNAEYLGLDNTETVTYSAKAAGTAAVADSVRWASRFEINRREAFASQGYFTLQDVVWEFSVAELVSTITPKEGDSITAADGVVWSVIEIRKIAFDTVWQAVCRRER